MKKLLALAAAFASILLLFASQHCEWPDSAATPLAPPPPDTGTRDVAAPVHGGPGISSIKTIFVIMMENNNWKDILGSPSAPYINSLLPTASYCDNYFDNPKGVHPSEPNYIWLEAGDNLGVVDDNPPSANLQTTTDHLVTYLTKAGVSWRAYEEDMMAGTCPLTDMGFYAPKHNPMVFFADIVGNPPSASAPGCVPNNEVPYTQLQSDLMNGTVAQYNFITPNLCDDMHGAAGCPIPNSVTSGDTWLMHELPKILASNAYKNGGAVFITWDESELGEYPIGMIVLSPLAKGGGYISHMVYFHSSMLRTVQEVMGALPLLRDAANQPNLSDLFTMYP